MTCGNKTLCVALCVALLLHALDRSSARADTSPALDRQLVERVVRALEDQVRATEKLIQATERAGERCKR